MTDAVKKVLVTGGAGFIGSHVADAYVARGYRVWVVDDLSSGRMENLNGDVEFLEMGIEDPALRELFREANLLREPPQRKFFWGASPRGNFFRECTLHLHTLVIHRLPPSRQAFF